jgi:hypothetical protein
MDLDGDKLLRIFCMCVLSKRECFSYRMTVPCGRGIGYAPPLVCQCLSLS